MKQPLLLTLLAVVLLVAPLALGLPDIGDAAVGSLFFVAALLGWIELWTDRERWLKHLAPTFIGAPILLWMLVFSAYPPAPDAPRTGDVAPDFQAVRVRDGATFRLAAQRGKGVLLVFHRGWW
ncbi:MAG: hypothetical protein ACYTGN_01950 [Planctomycetota bacterium]